jgi:hypothetical protein
MCVVFLLLSCFLSLPFFLFPLTHFAATPTDYWVNQILEFCGSWNERKSQSILMKHAKLICVMALSTTLLWQVQTKSWQIFRTNVNTCFRWFCIRDWELATTTTTTTTRRSLLFSDIISSWGTMLKVNGNSPYMPEFPSFKWFGLKERIIAKRTTKSN